MSSEVTESSRRWRWKGVLLLLVILPFLPELLILATSLYADLAGCKADEPACVIGPVFASDIIRFALRAGSLVGVSFSFGLAAVWLALCYFAITRGWLTLVGRLSLALLVSLIFGFLPYFGPMLSIGRLANPECNPNEGGIPPWCKIYGGDVGDAAHEAVRLGWAFFWGAPIAFAAFVLFVILAPRLLRKQASSRTEETQPRS